MSRRHRRIEPFAVQITALRPGSLGWGLNEGEPVVVRGAPPGAVVIAQPFQKKAGVIHARRGALVQAPPDAVAPRCALFTLCGGCSLQEIPLTTQRAAKQAMVETLLGDLSGVTVSPVAGEPEGYAYRNKVELSFGARRYVSEGDRAAGAPDEGRFLGFHAPGRFDKVVDAPRCELVSEGLNALITSARALPYTRLDTALVHAERAPVGAQAQGERRLVPPPVGVRPHVVAGAQTPGVHHRALGQRQAQGPADQHPQGRVGEQLPQRALGERRALGVDQGGVQAGVRQGAGGLQERHRRGEAAQAEALPARAAIFGQGPPRRGAPPERAHLLGQGLGDGPVHRGEGRWGRAEVVGRAQARGDDPLPQRDGGGALLQHSAPQTRRQRGARRAALKGRRVLGREPNELLQQGIVEV